MYVCGYQISSWQALSPCLYFLGCSKISILMSFQVTAAWWQATRALPCLGGWDGCHHTMVWGSSPALHCKDGKKCSLRSSPVPQCSSKQSAVILVSFVLKLLQELMARLKEGKYLWTVCVSPELPHFSRRKIETSFPVPFPIVFVLPGCLRGWLMSPQAKW